MDMQVKFPFGSLVDVFVTHVDPTSANIFVQINNEEAGKLDELMADIEEYIAGDRSGELAAGEVCVGGVFLAQYSADGRWYRARVLAVKPSQCEVFFIDYGNTDLVPLRSLRKTPDNFLKLPHQVYECEIDGFSALEITNFQATVDFLTEQVLEQELVCKAVSMKTSGVLIIQLFTDSTCSRYVLDAVRESGLVNSDTSTPIPAAAVASSKKPAMKDKKYKPLNLTLGFKDVFITSVNSPSDFSCQLISSSENLELLMGQLAEQYTDLGPQSLPLQSCTPGYPCCARFADDGCWYRAVITKVGSVASGFIDVKFMDYGNMQRTPLTDIRELKDEFLVLPAQLIECLHHGITQVDGYDDWPEESLVLFKKLTEDKHLVAQLHKQNSDGKYEVDLFDTTGDMDMQVSQILIAAGYAVKTSEFNPTPVRVPVTTPQTPQPSVIPQSQLQVPVQPPPQPQSYPYKKEELTPGKEEKVLVAATPSPWKLYVQLFRMAPKLEKLMADIENYYQHLSADEEWLSSPSTGDICCAKFTEDDCWYRAVVTEVLPSCQVKVLFVDYGNSETLPPKRIKKLVPRFSDLPCQGIECSLNRIQPIGKDWRPGDIKKFEDIALEKEGKLTVVANSNGVYRVNLVLGGRKELDASEQMLLANCASLVTGAVAKSENLHNVVAKEYIKASVSVGDYEDITISYAESPASFWCQLVKHKSDLDAIMNAVHEYCSNTGPKDTINSPRVGIPCCAMFSLDEGWYRGWITGVKKGNQVEVQFVDYGNSEIMPSSRLRAMKPEFMSVPAQAIKCELEHLGFDQSHHFTQELIEKFDEVTVEKELVAMIASHDKTNEHYVVVLHDATENILDLITPLLPKQAGTVGSVTVPKLDLQPGAKETVCITSVTSVSKFHCQKMSSADQLDNMMLLLEDHYSALSDGQETLTDISIGAYCAAKYTEDDAWYRTKITAVHGNSVDVHYIDYGNAETLPASRLKKLVSKFAELPEQIVTCSLTGDISGLSDTQFSDLVFDKTLDMQVIAVGSSGIAEVELVSKETKKSIREQLTRSEVKSVTVPKSTLQVGSKESGVVTSAACKTKFYFQLSKSADALDEMMNEIDGYYRELSESQDALMKPQAGTYCVAKFTEDDGWYRALVSSVSGNSLDVLYVDYGNSETIPVSRAKVLKSEFASLPSQAVECSLFNIGGGSDDSKFQALVLDKEFTLHMKAIGTNGVPEVELLDESGKSVGQYLTVAKTAAPSAFKPFAVSFHEADHIDVQPQICHTPDQFYCQVLTAQRIAAFGQLIEGLREYYGSLSKDSDRITNPTFGMPCCALYEADNSWNRGMIVNVLEQGMVEVSFVDYGNVELTHIDNLRTLKEEFLGLEEQAVLCILSSVKPTSGNQWSSAASQRFSALVNQRQLVAEVLKIGKRGSETCIEVGLYDTHDDARDDNIAEMLVTEGLAVPTSGAGIPSAPAVSAATLSSLQKLKPSSRQDLYITSIDSPDKFYCQLDGTDDKLATLMENLGIFYESLAPDELTVESPQPGTLCCALYSEDGGWYRAVIEANLQGPAKVRFIDYGNVESVQQSSIKVLTEEFIVDPVLAIECKLSGVRPAGNVDSWSTEEISAFQEIAVADKMFTALLKTQTEPFEVTLLDGSTDVADELVAKRFAASNKTSVPTSVPVSSSQAPTVQDYKKPVVNVGAKIGVLVTDISSPGQFHCQFAATGDDLDAMMNAMNEHYISLGSGDNHLVAPHVGQPCVAVYEQDESWYRAAIQNISGSNAKVLFTDYGNTQTCNLQDIKQIDSRFLELPLQAIECSLDCDKQWNDKETVLFTEMIGEQAVTVKVVGKRDERFLVEIYGENNKAISNSFLEKAAAAQAKPTAQNFKTMSLSPGHSAVGYVTHTRSDGYFYVQLAESEEPLDRVMAQIAEVYPNLGPTEKQLTSATTGSPCCALFTEDNTWNRALITKVTSHTEAEVEFVDYGNSVVVPLVSLKQLLPNFYESPQLAIMCRLANTKSNWLATDAELLEAHALDKAVDITFVQSQGTAWLVNAKVEATCLNDLPEFAETSATKSMVYSKATLDAREVAYFLSAESIDAVWLQPVKTEGELATLMETIAASDTREALPPAMLTAGQPCLSQFTEDDAWYRAQVIGVKDSSAHVRYVDYGNAEWLPVERLSPISDSLLSLPAQAVRCSLYEIPPSQARKTIEMLNEVCAEKVVEVEVKQSADGVPSVRLYDSETKEPVTSSPLTPGDSMQLKRSFTKSTFSTSGREQAYYLSAEATDAIWLQPIKREEELAALMDTIVASDTSEAVSASQLTAGQPCLSQFTEDNVWYRAEILAVKDGSVHVRYVDYGNEEWLPVARLGPISDPLLQLPAQAVRCTLHDIPENRAKQTVQELNEVCAEKTVEVEVVCQTADGMPVVKLFDAETQEAVIHHETQAVQEKNNTTAQKTIGFSKATFSSSEKERAYILSADSIDEVWLQPLTTEGELAALMGAIAETDTSKTLPPSLLVVGQVCLGQFTGDDTWYRAEITDVKDSQAHVRYVDYGNSEWLPRERMSTIRDSLMHLPAQAIMCSLYGAKPNDSDRIVEKLNEECAEKVVEVEIIQQNASGVSEVKLFDSETTEELLPSETCPEQAVVAHKGKLSFSKETISSREHVYFLSADAVDAVWLQPVKTEVELATVMSTIATSKSNEVLPQSLCIVGQSCLSQFTEDDTWYRAEIIAVKDGSVHVRYVDYGNAEWLTVQRLSPISDPLVQLPAQAVRCTLHDIPENIAETTVQQLNEACAEKTVEVEIVRQTADGMPVVKLYDAETKEAVIPKETQAVQEQAGATASKISLSTAIFSSSKREQAYYLSADLIDSVWLQPIKTEGELATLMETIAETKTSESLPQVSQIPGQVCLSQFTEDNAWYRAKIITVKDGSAHVRYVDYGNSEWLPTERLSPIKDGLLQLPAQAVRCSLHGVPSGDARQAVEKLNEVCAEKTVEVEVVGETAGIPTVKLYDAESKDIIISQDSEPVEVQIHTATQEKHSLPKATFSTAEKEQVYFLTADAIDSVWLQPVKTEGELATLMDTIATSKTDKTLPPASVFVGQVCLGQFTEDDTWYRAEIVEAKDSSVHVRYIDYGNSEWLPMDRLSPIKPALLTFPAQAVRCNIHGVPPSEADRAVETVNELCSEKTLEVEVVTRTNDGLCSVQLYELGHKDPINDKFISASEKSPIPSEVIQPVAELEKATEKKGTDKAAMNETGITSSNIAEGNNIKAFFVGGSSPDAVLLQLGESHDHLLAIMEQIGLAYSELDDEYSIAEPRVGQLCCALYSEDKQWYRAEILSVSDDGVHVKFLDYGNKETVPLSKIKQLKSEFLDLPVQAFECRLAGIVPASSDGKWSEDCLAWMEEILTTELRIEVLSVKDLTITVNLYFTSEEGENSVAQSLVDLGHGKFMEGPTVSKEEDVEEELFEEAREQLLEVTDANTESISAIEDEAEEEFVEAHENVDTERTTSAEELAALSSSSESVGSLGVNGISDKGGKICSKVADAAEIIKCQKLAQAFLADLVEEVCRKVALNKVEELLQSGLLNESVEDADESLLKPHESSHIEPVKEHTLSSFIGAREISITEHHNVQANDCDLVEEIYRKVALNNVDELLQSGVLNGRVEDPGEPQLKPLKGSYIQPYVCSKEDKEPEKSNFESGTGLEITAPIISSDVSADLKVMNSKEFDLLSDDALDMLDQELDQTQTEENGEVVASDNTGLPGGQEEFLTSDVSEHELEKTQATRKEDMSIEGTTGLFEKVKAFLAEDVLSTLEKELDATHFQKKKEAVIEGTCELIEETKECLTGDALTELNTELDEVQFENNEELDVDGTSDLIEEPNESPTSDTLTMSDKLEERQDKEKEEVVEGTSKEPKEPQTDEALITLGKDSEENPAREKEEVETGASSELIEETKESLTSDTLTTSEKELDKVQFEMNEELVVEGASRLIDEPTESPPSDALATSDELGDNQEEEKREVVEGTSEKPKEPQTDKELTTLSRESEENLAEEREVVVIEGNSELIEETKKCLTSDAPTTLDKELDESQLQKNEELLATSDREFEENQDEEEIVEDTNEKLKEPQTVDALTLLGNNLEENPVEEKEKVVAEVLEGTSEQTKECLTSDVLTTLDKEVGENQVGEDEIITEDTSEEYKEPKTRDVLTTIDKEEAKENQEEAMEESRAGLNEEPKVQTTLNQDLEENGVERKDEGKPESLQDQEELPASEDTTRLLEEPSLQTMLDQDVEENQAERKEEEDKPESLQEPEELPTNEGATRVPEEPRLQNMMDDDVEENQVKRKERNGEMLVREPEGVNGMLEELGVQTMLVEGKKEGRTSLLQQPEAPTTNDVLEMSDQEGASNECTTRLLDEPKAQITLDQDLDGKEKGKTSFLEHPEAPTTNDALEMSDQEGAINECTNRLLDEPKAQATLDEEFEEIQVDRKGVITQFLQHPEAPANDEQEQSDQDMMENHEKESTGSPRRHSKTCITG